jgi:hypothetical protein
MNDAYDNSKTDKRMLMRHTCEDCGRPYLEGSWELEEAICEGCEESLGHGICAVEGGNAFRYEDGIILCESCQDEAETRPHAKECGCDDCELADSRKSDHKNVDAQRESLRKKQAEFYKQAPEDSGDGRR